MATPPSQGWPPPLATSVLDVAAAPPALAACVMLCGTDTVFETLFPSFGLPLSHLFAVVQGAILISPSTVFRGFRTCVGVVPGVFPKPICVSGYSMNRRLPNDYLLPSGGFPGSAGASGGHYVLCYTSRPPYYNSIGFVKGEGFPGPGNIEIHYNSIGFVKGKGKRKFLQSTRALQ